MALSSSIFNFDRIRAITRLSWRRHLWHGLVLLMFAGTFWGSSLVLRNVAPGKTVKPRKFPDLDKVEVVILGDSQFGGLRGDQFTSPTLNLSLGGSALEIQAATLRYYAPRMPRLRVVLLDFDDISLRKDDVGNRKGDYSEYMQILCLPWHALPISMYVKMKTALRYAKTFKPVLVGPKIDLKSFSAFMSKIRSAKLGARLNLPNFISVAMAAEPVTPPNDLSIVNVAKLDPRPELYTTDVFHRFKHYAQPVAGGSRKMHGYVRSFPDGYFPKNLQALFDIVDYCDRHNLNLIFIRPLTTRAFYGARPKQWNQDLLDLLKTCRDRSSQPIPVWDYGYYKTFPLEYFYDPNHPRRQGHARFAHWLSDRLSQYPFPDDSGVLFQRNSENLLASVDPREDIWRGIELEAKSQTMKMVASPSDFVDRFGDYAFRITFPPQKKIYQSVGVPVSAGEEFHAEVWLWSDRKLSDLNLQLRIARHDQNPFEGGGLRIDTLDFQPVRYEYAYTFRSSYNDVRIQIDNQGDKPVTLFMACPAFRK